MASDKFSFSTSSLTSSLKLLALILWTWHGILGFADDEAVQNCECFVITFKADYKGRLLGPLNDLATAENDRSRKDSFIILTICDHRSVGRAFYLRENCVCSVFKTMHRFSSHLGEAVACIFCITSAIADDTVPSPNPEQE